MRSIRRSLLGYQLVLLALALGAIGVFVDRFANRAIRDREEAEARRIEKAYELRRHETKVQFDAELVSETKSLARDAQTKLEVLFGQWPGGRRGGAKGPPDGGRPGDPVIRITDPAFQAPPKEVQDYGLRATMLALVPPAFGWPHAETVAAITPPPRPPGGPSGRTLSPLWTGYDAPRLLARIQDAVRNVLFLEGEDHPGSYQLHLLAWVPGQPTRMTAAVRSPRLPADLALDPTLPERGSDVEYIHDDVDVAGRGSFRRVVKVGGRPVLYFPVWVAPPPQVAPRNLAWRPPDLFIRVVVHHARPYSELEGRLAEEQRNGEAELARVRDETRAKLTQLRARLGFIGLGSFAALVLGGWFIVARGLAPIRRLSDAVSLVSEKDFHLPVEKADLSRELVPILARLTHTFDQLRRAFEREKQAVADISHELRTPIASLLATIDVSLRKPRTPDRYRSALEDCRAIAKQLGQLVERIMTLASLDAGAARTAVIPTDAAEVAAGCAAVIRPLAEAHGLRLAVKADGPLDLDTDPDKLREVLMNLLHNAIEYNRPGGTVELAARREGGKVVFEVSDTGIGMAPEVREKIFERFFRADPSRNATGVHAGLGLAIVKEYVERLGGKIDVTSAPGAGSAFRVVLPASSAPATEPDDTPPPAERPRPDPRPRGEPAPAGS